MRERKEGEDFVKEARPTIIQANESLERQTMEREGRKCLHLKTITKDIPGPEYYLLPAGSEKMRITARGGDCFC